ncbi:MAG: dienelactone hydrolase family protein [Chitinophagaceae bacterium]|nr:dienelactone hydrolase family protein [Chitinophagaceae bacterium]
MHDRKIIYAGTPVKEAAKVLILLHGRGASAEDILSLSSHLQVPGFALLAPQATNHSWYPYSFLQPTSANEPWLSSALGLMKNITDELIADGKQSSDIYLAGFSQGACLTLEFATRNATHFGGIVAFTGGLIGDGVDKTKYSGDFDQTPIFIGTSDPDPHVPISRVNETAEIITGMNGKLKLEIYKGMGHTISMPEIQSANDWIFKASSAS